MKNFDNIRPLEGNEVPEAMQRLLNEKQFIDAAAIALPGVSAEELHAVMSSCKTIPDFQKKLVKPFLFGLAERTTSGVSLDVTHFKNQPATFISNHRDIILDAAFFNIYLFDKGYDTTEIAIGDNLLIHPWIKDLVRVNRSFIVERGVSTRQMLEVSSHLSAYIHHVIGEKKHSVWIAQREGRAKDSNDRTQESLLKMLNLGRKGRFLENIIALNITPLSISYEYDPCDYLKAAEFQLKRDNPDYKKQGADDLLNMRTGLLGFKGKAHFYIGKSINEQLKKLPADWDKKTQITATGNIIDSEIHKNYCIYSVNYIALDMLEKENRFSNQYTEEEKQAFETYLEKQLEKITIPNKDNNFLKNKILEMYSNPLKNKINAESEAIGY